MTRMCRFTPRFVVGSPHAQRPRNAYLRRVTAPVHLTSIGRHPRLLLIPLMLMLLLAGARAVCRLVQAAIPLAGVLVPLPLEDAVQVSAHRVR